MTAATEKDFADDIERSLPRNYAALLFHGMLGQTGFRLLHAPIFLPAYLFLLSGSTLAVGGALALQHLGAALSALVGASIIEHRKRVLPVLLAVGGGMRLQILGIALAGLLLSGQAALGAVCVFLFLFGLFNGMQAVAFNYVMTKLIPLKVRGRLTGIRNLLAGLVSAAVGYVGGSYFIDHNTWGNGYSTTFVMAFVLTVAGMAALLFVTEPEPPTMRAQTKLSTRLKDVPALLREDRSYTGFIIARACAAFGTAAVPFYILYAGRSLGLSGELVALLSSSFMLVQTVSNLAWGSLADRFGNRAVFIASVAVWILATAGLFLPFHAPLVFMAIFGGLGAGLGGFQIASMNMVLEFGTREDLPLRIALANTSNSLIFAVGPLLGGVLVTFASYETVFAVAIAAKLIAVAIVLAAVEEPRNRPLQVLDED